MIQILILSNIELKVEVVVDSVKLRYFLQNTFFAFTYNG